MIATKSVPKSMVPTRIEPDMIFNKASDVVDIFGYIQDILGFRSVRKFECVDDTTQDRVYHEYIPNRDKITVDITDADLIPVCETMRISSSRGARAGDKNLRVTIDLNRVYETRVGEPGYSRYLKLAEYAILLED